LKSCVILSLEFGIMTTKTVYDVYTTRKEMDAYRAIQEKEVHANYGVFKKHLPRLLKEHRGKYILLRKGELLDMFDTRQDAYEEGSKRFPDFVFSVQEITDFVAYISCGPDPDDGY